jgi:hypothetical protein
LGGVNASRLGFTWGLGFSFTQSSWRSATLPPQSCFMGVTSQYGCELWLYIWAGKLDSGTRAAVAGAHLALA